MMLVDQDLVWGLLDCSDGMSKGYYRIQRNGVRVADLFPYAPGVDAAFIREQGERIVEAMNDVERRIEDKRGADDYNAEAGLTSPLGPDGVDPTTSELMKPRGNNGVVSADICFNALLLIGNFNVTEAEVATWTIEERDRAYDWAMRIHLHASDNDDVFVPEKPDCIRRLEPRLEPFSPAR